MQIAQFATVRKLIDARFAQMRRSVQLKRNNDDDAIRQYMASPEGMVTMTSLRLALDGMAAEEQTQNQRRGVALTDSQNQLRRGFYVLAGLNLLLVTLGGIFLSQESRRRRREATEAEERNVRLGLILAEAVKAHSLQARPEQVRALVEEQAQSYERPAEVVKWFYQSPERLREMESLVAEDNVVAWALRTARTEDRAIEFNELMGRQ